MGYGSGGVSLGGPVTAGAEKMPKGSSPGNPSLYSNQGTNVTIVLKKIIDQVDSHVTLTESPRSPVISSS